MDVKATRFNLFEDSNDWKPYHHDAAAIKPKYAKTQNFTAVVSFGLERDISIIHAKNDCKVNIPLMNGHTYCFGKDVNCEWQHGVPKLAKRPKKDTLGRISIVAWGWCT